jgi:2-methylisocitrate lyase-like PEP mutase family enzyme
VEALAAAGVRRISVGPSLFRAAYSGLLDAAREISGQGTFTYTDRSLTSPELYGLIGK